MERAGDTGGRGDDSHNDLSATHRMQKYRAATLGYHRAPLSAYGTGLSMTIKDDVKR